MIYFLSIYLLVFVLSFTDFSKRYDNFGINFSIILLSLLSGLKNTGGKDFEVYRFLYNTGEAIGNTEIGYTFINNICSNIGFSYNIFLFIISFVSIFLLVKAFKRLSVYPNLSLLLYMGTYFLFYNIVLNRQMIAVALFLWIVILWNKNKFYSLILLFIAFSFHKSIIIILPFLIIFELIKKHKILFGICFTTAIILAYFINLDDLMINIFYKENSMIHSRLYGYIKGEEFSNYSVEIFEYIKLIIMLCVILPIRQILTKDTKISIFFFLYCIGAVFLIWSSKHEIMFRLFMYFDLSFIILLPYSLNIYISKYCISYKQRKATEILSYTIIGFMAILSIYYRVSHFGNMASIYKFYFMEYL